MTVSNVVIIALTVAFAVAAVWFFVSLRRAKKAVDIRIAAQRKAAELQDIRNRWEAEQRPAVWVQPSNYHKAVSPSVKAPVKVVKPKPVKRHTGTSLADSAYTYEVDTSFGNSDYSDQGSSYSGGSSYSSDSGSSSSSSDSGSSSSSCD